MSQDEFRACILLLHLLKPLGGSYHPLHFTARNRTLRSEKQLAQREESQDDQGHTSVRPAHVAPSPLPCCSSLALPFPDKPAYPFISMYNWRLRYSSSFQCFLDSDNYLLTIFLLCSKLHKDPEGLSALCTVEAGGPSTMPGSQWVFKNICRMN